MNEPTPNTPASDDNRLIAERRGKLARLRAEGIAYPNDFQPDSKSVELHEAYGKLEKEELERLARRVKIAGRMMLKRVMGKASFATVQDGAGRIQVFLDRNTVGE